MINGEVDDAMEAIADVVRERLDSRDADAEKKLSAVQDSLRTEWNGRYERLETALLDSLNRAPAPINPEFKVDGPDMAPVAKIVGEALERYAKEPKTDLSGLETKMGQMAQELGNLAKSIEDHNELILKVLKEMTKRPEAKEREFVIKHGEKESRGTFK